MATKKISEFTTLGSLSDSDILPVVNAGSNKKITGATLKTYAQSGLTIPTDVSDLTDTTSLLGSGSASWPVTNTAGVSGPSEIAIGQNAGLTTQGDSAVAIGYSAGQTTQGTRAVAIGRAAGGNEQGSYAVAVGLDAGATTQGTQAVAVGFSSGKINQGFNSVAVGWEAGYTGQGIEAVAIGTGAGHTNQGANSIILNATGSTLNQTVANTFTVKPVRQANTANALYYNSSTGEITYDVAGSGTAQIQSDWTQATSSALDFIKNKPTIPADVSDLTDTTSLLGSGSASWPVTNTAGASGPSEIAIGQNAGLTSQGEIAVAVGANAGYTGQGVSAVAIGAFAGETSQGAQAVAIGISAGETTQGVSAVAIGQDAGMTVQGDAAVAIGWSAGLTSQGDSAVAIGRRAGETTQGIKSIAIGEQAGMTTQGGQAVAVGLSAGFTGQGGRAVAIGWEAGYTGQGIEAVAIGRLAGATNQAANSIIINATGAQLNQTTANTFTVAPIRNASGVDGVLQYNTTTKEVSYSNEITVNSNVWTFGTDGTLTLPAGGTIKEDGGLTGAIKLTPTGGANEYQALLIYPTGTADGDHIHLTAGGGTTDLYLGNDLQYVKIEHGGNVVIHAFDSTANGHKQWLFDKNGDLTAPRNIILDNPVTTVTTTVTGTVADSTGNPFTFRILKADNPQLVIPFADPNFVLKWTGSDAGSVAAGAQAPGGQGPSSLVSDDGTYWNFNSWFGLNTSRPNTGTEFTVEYGLVVSDTMISTTATNLVIEADDEQWKFGTDGVLTLPDNSVIASYKPVTVIAGPTGVQTISDNASATRLTFIESVDSVGAFTNSTFTVPYTGYYQFNTTVYFTSNVTLTDGFLVIVNTTAGLNELDTLYYGAHTGRVINGSSMQYLTAGDTIALFFRQVSGNVVDIGSSSRLTIHRVSIS